MSVDIAVDLLTGDLIPTSSGDFALRSGPDALEQRVRNCLLIPKEGWMVNRQLGSRVYDVLRSTMPRAAGEIELAVREALDEMGEVSVISVVVTPMAPAGVRATIQYTPINQVDDGTLSSTTTTTIDFGSTT